MSLFGPEEEVSNSRSRLAEREKKNKEEMKKEQRVSKATANNDAGSSNVSIICNNLTRAKTSNSSKQINRI